MQEGSSLGSVIACMTALAGTEDCSACPRAGEPGAAYWLRRDSMLTLRSP
jgi:hypothetical protein